jgi:tetratricopeptide (TPR) repeat protein
VPASDAARLIGRERDLDELLAAVAAAAGGQGQLGLIAGQAGMGKTRLVEEVTHHARALGMRVAWAACIENGAPAFWPWIQLLRQLDVDEPSRVHPALVPGIGWTTEGDPMLARAELFDAVTTLVGGAADRQPLLVVLEDAHWADLLSLRLLAFLGPLLRGRRLLALVTYRDDEAMVGTPLGDLLPELSRHAFRLSLRGLDAASVAALVTAVTSQSPSPRALEAVHRRTGGNPLFARELARLLAADDALFNFGGPSGSAMPVPDTVRGVLIRRLARVSEPCRRLLTTGSVLGEEFALVLAAELAGVPADDVPDLVDEAHQARLLRDLGIGRVSFDHALTRATLLDALGRAGRVRTHREAAAALEIRRAAGHQVSDSELAHHFLEAGIPANAAKAFSYAITAARQSMSVLAFEDAARLFERAVGVLDLDPPAGDRAEALLELGDAQVASGELATGRATLLAAAGLARQSASADQLARSALGLGAGGGFEIALFDHAQIGLLEEALDALPRDPSHLRAWLLARLSVALSFVASVERRLELSDLALEMARGLGDDAAVAYALAARADAIAGPADADRRLDDAAEIIDIARRSGDRRAELLGRRLRVVGLMEQGELTSADRAVDAYEIVAKLMQQPLYSWYVPLWRAALAEARGLRDEAAACIADAERLGSEAESENATQLVSAFHAFVAATENRLEDMLGLLPELGDLPGSPTWVSIANAYAQAGAGNLDEARRILDSVGLAGLQALPVDSEWLPATVQAARAVSWLGGHPLAAWLYAELLPHRMRWSVEGIGAYTHGSVERFLGLLASVLGRADDARRHFAAALEANAKAGAAGLVTLTEIDAATVGQRVAPVPDTNVFCREGDVWVLTFAGRTVRTKDSKGMRDLARLLADTRREIAALDLAATPGAAPAERDVGEVIDQKARDAYKARLRDLEEEIDEATARGDIGRQQKAEDERDALVAQLTSAYGLGRARRSAGSAERARSTVTARIRDAMRRIEREHHDLGSHLRRSVRTGSFCVYDPAEPVDWQLSG